jgi:hypothetical protein
MAMHLRPSRSAAPVGADPITLEDAELAAHEAAHPQVSFHELPTDVVDMAQLTSGLVDDLSVQKLGQSHQDPGTFPTMRAQRASPRSSRSSAAERFKITTDVTESTSCHGT